MEGRGRGVGCGVGVGGACSSGGFTPLAEKYLYHLGVGEGGEVAQVLLVAGDLPEDSPHDLPLSGVRGGR